MVPYMIDKARSRSFKMVLTLPYKKYFPNNALPNFNPLLMDAHCTIKRYPKFPKRSTLLASKVTTCVQLPILIVSN